MNQRYQVPLREGILCWKWLNVIHCQFKDILWLYFISFPNCFSSRISKESFIPVFHLLSFSIHLAVIYPKIVITKYNNSVLISNSYKSAYCWQDPSKLFEYFEWFKPQSITVSVNSNSSNILSANTIYNFPSTTKLALPFSLTGKSRIPSVFIWWFFFFATLVLVVSSYPLTYRQNYKINTLRKAGERWIKRKLKISFLINKCLLNRAKFKIWLVSTVFVSISGHVALVGIYNFSPSTQSVSLIIQTTLAG